nr:hypothetical protein [Tanacetum cinerariifolium]GEY45110.1 hypothetical protein [Tanacetum cinerariifolium]
GYANLLCIKPAGKADNIVVCVKRGVTLRASRRGIRAFEQETQDLDVEIKQMNELKANYDVTSPQELRHNQVNEGMSQHPSYGVNASSCLRRNQHHQGRMTYPSHRYCVTSMQGLRRNTI